MSDFSDKTDLNKPKGILQVIGETFRIYKKEFWKFILIYLIAFLVLNFIVDNLIEILLSPLINFSNINKLSSENLWNFTFGNLVALEIITNPNYLTNIDIWGSFLFSFISAIIRGTLLAIPLALTVLMATTVIDKKQQSLKAHLKNLYYSLVPIVVIGVIFSFIYELSYYFIIPAILVGTFGCLLFPVLLEEKLKPKEVLKRSYTLVRNQFFPILAVLVIIGILQYIVTVFGHQIYDELFPTIFQDSSSDVINSIMSKLESSFIAGLFASILAPLSGISASILYRESLLVQRLKVTAGRLKVPAATSLTKEFNATEYLVKQTLKDVKPQYCSTCGNTIEESERFCGKCGATLNQK
ncbi:MAG: zinc ribbon domain-containing protein [Candidatus Hodarchaeales archaeon]